MGLPDGKDWADRIRTDLEWRKSNIDWRMNKALLLLDSTSNIRNEKLRTMAPIARRVARGMTTLDFLHRLPHIDAEYKQTDGDDQSNFIEDIVTLIADRAGVRDRLKQMQATLLWSPVAFVKMGMPLVGIERDDGRSEATPEMIEGTDDFREEYEEVPQEVVAALKLGDQKIPELDGTLFNNIYSDPLPSPSNSLDIPWCDWVNPFHIVTDRGVNEINETYYIGHLVVRTESQFRNGNYINTDKVIANLNALSAADGKSRRSGAIHALGNSLLNSFNMPSATKGLVVLCEVYIREDPDDESIKQMMGTLDLLSGVWVKEPRHNPLGVMPYVSVKAADEAPGIYSGPSYIEQAWDDIEELAWSRDEAKKHVLNYRTKKDLIPENLEFDDAEWAKFNNPAYSGPVRYSGGSPAQIAQSPAPPPMPNALIQWIGMMETNFSRNTGVTATQQGEGASNKVATAFRQEGKFADERRSEIRYRLYQAYARIMTVLTYLIQRYMTEPVEVKRGTLKFQFSGDMLRGIMGYTIDVIDLERNDPLSDRLLEIQTIERIMQHPTLASQFEPRELAKRVAQLNRWGNRVMKTQSTGGTEPGEGQAEGAGGPNSPTESGPSSVLGSGVDSGQENGNTVDAVEGAPMRAV